MGLPDGAPIPIYNNNGTQAGFKKDRSGQTVITKLDEDMLRQVAAAGNGSYARANNASTGLNKIFDDISQIEKKEIETRQFTDYEDQFQYYLGAASILVILELLIAARRASWGRKFDFLTQEFNREANTLCSKSNMTELTRIGLDLKVVIDQMREQVQNVE